MPVNGDMPMGSSPPACASSAWWILAAVLTAMVARCQWSLVRFSLLNLRISLMLVLIWRWIFPLRLMLATTMVVVHVMKEEGDLNPAKWRRGSWRLGSAPSPSTTTKERRRPLISPEEGSRWAVFFMKLRRLLSSSETSGRRAVFLSSLMNPMVEGRPLAAFEPDGSSSSSSSRLHAIREAVLLKFGVHLPHFWHPRMV